MFRFRILRFLGSLPRSSTPSVLRTLRTRLSSPFVILCVRVRIAFPFLPPFGFEFRRRFLLLYLGFLLQPLRGFRAFLENVAHFHGYAASKHKINPGLPSKGWLIPYQGRGTSSTYLLVLRELVSWTFDFDELATFLLVMPKEKIRETTASSTILLRDYPGNLTQLVATEVLHVPWVRHSQNWNKHTSSLASTIFSKSSLSTKSHLTPAQRVWSSRCSKSTFLTISRPLPSLISVSRLSKSSRLLW